MKNTITVKLSGGFHGSGEITVRAKVTIPVRFAGATAWHKDTRFASLSDSQIRKIQRHFCGMSDCTCGGPMRAEIELPEGWETNASLNTEGTMHFATREPSE